ncbi:MAG: HAD family hydrolase [Chloroflexi bacterium]|nr:HAD family hydrolase [Chloroflexota bacterium]
MEAGFSQIEAIFFDIDGTLSDSDDQVIEEVMRHLRFLRLVFNDPSLRKIARYSVSLAMSVFNNFYHFIDRFGLDDFFVKLFPQNKRKEHPNFEKDRALIDGVRETLQILHQRYKLGIVSARSQEGVQYFLELFSLEEFFDVIVSANTCYYTKPFPHPLLYAAQKIRISPQHCLMVGDTIVDILAGKAAGMTTIGVLCGFGTLQELRRAAADHILDSPPNLLNLLG